MGEVPHSKLDSLPFKTAQDTISAPHSHKSTSIPKLQEIFNSNVISPITTHQQDTLEDLPLRKTVSFQNSVEINSHQDFELKWSKMRRPKSKLDKVMEWFKLKRF